MLSRSRSLEDRHEEMHLVGAGVHKLTSRTSVGVLDWSCCSLALLPALTPLSCRYCWPCCRLVVSTRSICSWHALKQSWNKKVSSCLSRISTIQSLLRQLTLYTAPRHEHVASWNTAFLPHLTCKWFNSLAHMHGVPQCFPNMVSTWAACPGR